MFKFYEIVWGRDDVRGCTTASCDSLRTKVRAIRDAMREGADWIEVWVH